MNRDLRFNWMGKKAIVCLAKIVCLLHASRIHVFAEISIGAISRIFWKCPAKG